MNATIDPRPDRLAATLGRCRPALFWAGMLGFMVNLLVLAVPLYILQLYDRVIVSRSLPTLFFLTVIVVGALVLYAVLEALRSHLFVRMGVWLDRALGPSTLMRAVEAGLQGHPYRAEALRDIGVVRSFLGGAGVIAFMDAPWTPLFVALLFVLHPLLGTVGLLGALALLGLALLSERTTHLRLRSANAAAVRAQQIADAAVRHAEVVDAMGMRTAVARRWASESFAATGLQGKASDRAAAILSISMAVRLLVQVAIFGAGAYLVTRDLLSAGAMIAAGVIAARGMAPVERAIASWRQAVQAAEAYSRLRAFLRAPPVRQASMPLPKPCGQLRVDRATYQPPGAPEPILRNISFRLSAGEAVGIIGPSAAGKSTLARLLIGAAAPSRGAVRLDGADVFKWNPEELGRWMGYLPQDVALFDASVRDNIARFGDVSPDMVVAAAQLAGAHDMILNLPNGYETRVGDGGVSLSGGQRQRIGLARALLGNPVFVVLDEPNANLDAEGEQALNAAIANLKSLGSTVAVIGHRAAIMTHMDKLLVLKGGKIEMFGAKETVLAKLARSGVATIPRRAAKVAPVQPAE